MTVRPPERRPWYRQRWNTIVAGFAFAFLAGMAFAYWIHIHGEWKHGLGWERTLLERAHVSLPRWLDAIVFVMPWLGTNITLVPLSIGVVLWLWLRLRRHHEAVYMAVVQLGSSSLNPSLKFLYDRDRPSVIPRRGWYDWAAYPSGHAIASVAVLTTLAIILYRVKGWRWPGYVIAPLLIVSLISRLYLGVHWPTDVIGGILIGLVWLAFTYYAFRENTRRTVPSVIEAT